MRIARLVLLPAWETPASLPKVSVRCPSVGCRSVRCVILACFPGVFRSSQIATITHLIYCSSHITKVPETREAALTLPCCGAAGYYRISTDVSESAALVGKLLIALGA